MNKTMIASALIIAAVLINWGLAKQTQMGQAKEDKAAISLQNEALSNELRSKSILKQQRANRISDAFALFINEKKIFETYSGTRMDIVFAGAKENEDLEGHYVDTKFRGVKGLPITFKVDKFSNETGVVEALNDIHLLEAHTDFKVSEISTENNSLIVKGELYGI